jgi:hypothetical protein
MCLPGKPCSLIERAWHQEHSVVLEVDVVGDKEPRIDDSENHPCCGCITRTTLCKTYGTEMGASKVVRHSENEDELRCNYGSSLVQDRLGRGVVQIFENQHLRVKQGRPPRQHFLEPGK